MNLKRIYIALFKINYHSLLSRMPLSIAHHQIYLKKSRVYKDKESLITSCVLNKAWQEREKY